MCRLSRRGSSCWPRQRSSRFRPGSRLGRRTSTVYVQGSGEGNTRVAGACNLHLGSVSHSGKPGQCHPVAARVDVGTIHRTLGDLPVIVMSCLARCPLSVGAPRPIDVADLVRGPRVIRDKGSIGYHGRGIVAAVTVRSSSTTSAPSRPRVANRGHQHPLVGTWPVTAGRVVRLWFALTAVVPDRAELVAFAPERHEAMFFGRTVARGDRSAPGRTIVGGLRHFHTVRVRVGAVALELTRRQSTSVANRDRREARHIDEGIATFPYGSGLLQTRPSRTAKHKAWPDSAGSSQLV